MRIPAISLAIITASSMVGAASAANSIKGTYYLVGSQVCLVAPAGFKQDSKGNFTIPIGDSNHSLQTSEGLVIYREDGTGEVRQNFVTIVPPPNPFGAAVSGGTISYSFTYTSEGDRAYRMTVKPGTYRGVLNAGPNAGEQFTVEGESRLIRVSDDRKKIALAIDKPHLQKQTFSGSPTPVPRICTSVADQSLIDESVDTVGKSK